MALGDITSTATFYATMALLEVALEAGNTGAATAGADITTYHIIPDASLVGYWLVTIARAAA